MSGCGNCGAAVGSSDDFCTGCGSRLGPTMSSVRDDNPGGIKCVNCGALVGAEDIFCTGGGQRMGPQREQDAVRGGRAKNEDAPCPRTV